nr:TetR family transcriptional regulator [Kineosporia mesophila]
MNAGVNSVRPRDAEGTKAVILGAARLQFGQHGFDRTTIRSVAAAAGVDPALVMHYFRTKNGLFEAAATLDVQLPDLTGVPPGRVAAVLVPVFVKLWGPDGPLLPLLRAATSNPAARDMLIAIFSEKVAPALGPLTPDRAQERAALIGSHLIGVAVARHIIGLPVLEAMPDETLMVWLGPVFEHYLTEPRTA